MGSRTRSSSFKVLPRDSPGDGELLHQYTANGTLASSTATTRDGSHRKRRNRQKHKKISLLESSIPLKLGFDLSPGIHLLGDGCYAGNLLTEVLEDECYDGGRSSVSTPGEGIEYKEEEFILAKDTEVIPLMRKKEESHENVNQDILFEMREKVKLNDEANHGLDKVEKEYLQPKVNLDLRDDLVEANYRPGTVKKDHLQPKDNLDSNDDLVEANHGIGKVESIQFQPKVDLESKYHLLQANHGIGKEEKDHFELKVNLDSKDDSVEANPGLDKIEKDHLQPKSNLDSADDFVKAKDKPVTSKDELVKTFLEVAEEKHDHVKTSDLIDKRKDGILEPIDGLSKAFDHESEVSSTNVLHKSIDPTNLSSGIMVNSSEAMHSAVNGTFDSTVDDNDVSQSQESYVGATFVDSIVHNVARHPSFGDSDGYDFDITYKAHVSTGTDLVIASPLYYFVSEVLRSSSTSQDVQSVENVKKREHVYNTMFHVPWRCELLIFVGFFVCLDSFLTLLTIMPVRVCIFLWRLLHSRRKFRRLRADELGDLGSLLVLVTGVTLLQQTDISYIYHMIRSQATIKLYVVYNVLEIFDKLCQSFGSDVLQVLMNSAENVATCSHHVLLSEMLRLTLDQCIAVFSSVLHSFIILAQAITVSAAIRSHNNALLTLLISNNFAEIKSNVFKRLTKDNLHKLAYLDTVERFHIIAHLFFVLAQNLLAANEPWLWAFAGNAGIVFSCEVLVDVIKHAFLAKFNEIKPSAYSEFLQSLCEQTLSTQSHEVHKTMSFVPFAPACVVIRVLIPLYAAYLPRVPFWAFCCILVYAVTTYCFLVAMKILVSFVLMKFASWYVARSKKNAKLYHLD